jgi:hypothetical protein
VVKTTILDVDEESYHKWQGGMLIQNAFHKCHQPQESYYDRYARSLLDELTNFEKEDDSR